MALFDLIDNAARGKQERKRAREWERKTCKTCKSYDCPAGRFYKPTNRACDSYEGK